MLKSLHGDKVEVRQGSPSGLPFLTIVKSFDEGVVEILIDHLLSKK